MQEDRHILRVGAAMLVGMTAALAYVLAVGGTDLRPQVRAHVAMSHAGNLREGAAVQVAGRAIGKVDAIRLAPGGGGVLLDVHIEARRAFMAPINGEWFVSSKGVFGERYLEVGPPAGGAAPARAVRDGDVIRGVDPPQLDRMAATGMRNLAAWRALLRELEPAWQELVRELDALSDNLDAVMPPGPDVGVWGRLFGEARAQRAFWRDSRLAAAGAGGLVDRGEVVLARARERIAGLRARLDRLEADLARVRGQLDPARLAGFRIAAARARAALARAEQTLAVVEELAAFVAAGRGNVGGFLADDELADFAKMTNRIIKQRPWEVLGHPRRKDVIEP